jgi:hypothetical protein
MVTYYDNEKQNIKKDINYYMFLTITAYICIIAYLLF